MTNPANTLILTGRIAREPAFFKNSDGSQKVKVTLAVQDNFKSGPDKTRKTQFLPMEQFLSAAMGQGAWANVTTGSLIQVLAHVESNNYEKDGKTVYGGINIVVDSVNYLETKAKTEARRKNNEEPETPENATPAEPAPQAAPEHATEAAPETNNQTADDEMPFTV